MNLTSDLIRDVLLCVKNHLRVDPDDTGLYIEPVFWKDVFLDDSLCRKYDIDDIKYCLYKLSQEQFIEASITYGGNYPQSIEIQDISFKGHELLNTIKDDTIWNYLKSKLHAGASMSISTFYEISQSLVISWAKNKLGL